MLKDRSLLLGVTGSVAAYKSIEFIKRLRYEGASVAVIMTEASRRFITPLSVELASGSSVYCDMFESPLSHVSLPSNSDLFVIAPATANIISKYANGIADDFLSTALLAFKGLPGQVIIAPAMNWRMYENPVFQKNIQYLTSVGVKIVGPEKGSLACGEEGIGRMADIDSIVELVKSALLKQDMAGEHVLVTAGPTRQYIDPIRYISNRSSGKMGYAIAKIAKRRGANVTLISGPVFLAPPYGIDVINVETADDMHMAVMDNIKKASTFVMSAAVADFMPDEKKANKIEKDAGAISKLPLQINFIKTKDILGEVGKLKNRPFAVGFSAETGYRLDRAKRKLHDKDIDMIVFNDVSSGRSGFDVDTNKVIILSKDKRGIIYELPLQLMLKEDVAMSIFDRIIEIKSNGQ